MSKLYLISDHHFGHANIINFERENRQGETIDDHDDWLIDQHNLVVKKRDTVWMLGDFYLGYDPLKMRQVLHSMNGTKHLVLGNHDLQKSEQYIADNLGFASVNGCYSYKRRYVFTHIPIHENSLERWSFNFHGHIHSHDSPTRQHINVCVERCEGRPRTIDEWFEFYNTTPNGDDK